MMLNLSSTNSANRSRTQVTTAERSANLSPPSPDTTLTRLESVRLHLPSVITVKQLIRLACNGGIKNEKNQRVPAAPASVALQTPHGPAPRRRRNFDSLITSSCEHTLDKTAVGSERGVAGPWVYLVESSSPMESRRERLMCRVSFKVDRRRCELAYRSRAAGGGRDEMQKHRLGGGGAGRELWIIHSAGDAVRVCTPPACCLSGPYGPMSRLPAAV